MTQPRGREAKEDRSARAGVVAREREATAACLRAPRRLPREREGATLLLSLPFFRSFAGEGFFCCIVARCCSVG